QRPDRAGLAQGGRAQALKQVLERTFAADGPFAEHVPGFRLRAGQLEMSEAIGEAIENTAVLVAEAGTGTGKTLAYLVPALLAGGKVIVSTGTKTLQDQLFDRDLPAVRAALASGATIALLKRRASPDPQDRALRRGDDERRPRRSRRRAGGRAGVGARNLDARELPRPGLP